MPEQVQTGGLQQFRYPKQYEFKLDENRRKVIEQGYAEAAERKRKERRNKWSFWIVVIFVILILLGYILLKK